MKQGVYYNEKTNSILFGIRLSIIFVTTNSAGNKIKTCDIIRIPKHIKYIGEF